MFLNFWLINLIKSIFLNTEDGVCESLVNMKQASKSMGVLLGASAMCLGRKVLQSLHRQDELRSC